MQRAAAKLSDMQMPPTTSRTGEGRREDDQEGFPPAQKRMRRGEEEKENTGKKRSAPAPPKPTNSRDEEWLPPLVEPWAAAFPPIAPSLQKGLKRIRRARKRERERMLYVGGSSAQLRVRSGGGEVITVSALFPPRSDRRTEAPFCSIARTERKIPRIARKRRQINRLEGAFFFVLLLHAESSLSHRSWGRGRGENRVLASHSLMSPEKTRRSQTDSRSRAGKRERGNGTICIQAVGGGGGERSRIVKRDFLFAPSTVSMPPPGRLCSSFLPFPPRKKRGGRPS